MTRTGTHSDLTDTAAAGGAAAPGAGDRARLLAGLARLRPVVIRPASGWLRHPYCVPGGFYDQQWDWDGFFIASHLAARTPAQPEYLKYWTLNVLASELPDGEVAACIDPGGVRLGNSSLRLKPFLAQGAELAARRAGDYDWLEPHYPAVVRLATRREATEVHRRLGLFGWTDAMESGADNNPALGSDRAVAATLAACDASAFFYREYLALARLAARFGRSDDNARFACMARGLRVGVNEFLWDHEAGTYWNLDVVTHRRTKRVSYSNFVPLWAGMAPPARAGTMIERYLWNEQHMLGPWGLRSLSRQDPEYNNDNIIAPCSNWRGPVWPIANYFYFTALLKHGFREQAAELVRRLTRLYLRDLDFCGSLHENYHGDTGAPLAPSAAHSRDGVEGGFVGWNLLLEDMIEMLDGRPDILEWPG